MKFNDTDLKLNDSDENLPAIEGFKTNSNERINVETKEKIVKVDNENINKKPLVLNSGVTREHFSPALRQTLAAAGPLIATVCSGLTSGYSAILLPQLKDANSTIHITRGESSWIASMAALPMAAGCLLAGILMERYGRKLTQILVCCTFMVGWGLIFAATSITHLLIGRFITGFAVGLLGPPVSVYIAETSSPKLRGTLLAVVSFSISLGVLVAHLLGTFYTWRFTAIFSSIVPCFSIVILLIVPESPNYLASKGYFQKAEASFRWLRGSSMSALEEMEELLNKYRQLLKVKTHSQTLREPTLTIWQKLTKMYFIKPFLIMNAFFAITQCTGVNAVTFYSVDIITDTMGPSFNSYLAMAIVDVTRLVMSVLACILLRKFNRRSLAVFSGAGTAIVLVFLTVFIGTVDFKSSSILVCIPLVSLILYICFISVGLVPLPWVMVGEIFPSAVRSLGSGICTCMCFIYFFIVVKTAPFMFYDFGSMYAYGMYGAVALVGTVILYVFLPETKGKTLEQIESIWIKKEYTGSQNTSNIIDNVKRSDILVA